MGSFSDSRGVTAAESGLVSCHTCSLLCRAEDHRPAGHPRCPRCGAPLHRRKPASLSRTWALVLAAMLLYIPANVLPIMLTTNLGQTQSDTILSGVVYFMFSGSWHIALIIFVASILVPLVKLVVLVYLLLTVQFQWLWRPRERTRLYRLTEAVGRWSMVDIYVVTIMVALVKLGNLANIEAQPGAVFFGAVVVITMFAAMSFDPRIILDNLESTHDKPAA